MGVPAKRLLIVEGPDDKHVIRHLLKKLGYETKIVKENGRVHFVCRHSDRMAYFRIVDKGGINQLLDAIAQEAKVSGRLALGIVADANETPCSRWKAISDRIRKIEVEPLSLPDEREPEGTVIGNMLRVGVWLMPDNRRCGEIEDFVQEMIPDDDPVWPLSKQYIGDIPSHDRKFTRKKRTRAELYAWMATRKEPSRMGTAIGSGDLKTDGELCASFSRWIQRLFT